ncbi:MAG: hypothetical protein WKH64_08420 [Chloroflexia bacterium]
MPGINGRSAPRRESRSTSRRAESGQRDEHHREQRSWTDDERDRHEHDGDAAQRSNA